MAREPTEVRAEQRIGNIAREDGPPLFADFRKGGERQEAAQGGENP